MLWVLANIAANSENEAIAVVNNNFLPNLIYYVSSRNYEVKREAVWVLSNICKLVNCEETLVKMVKADIVNVYYDILQNEDSENAQVVMLALSGISCLLSKTSQAKVVFDRLGGFDVLVAL